MRVRVPVPVRAAWYSSAQMQLKDYIPSGIWDLVDARGSLRVADDADGRQRAQVIYELLLRRKTLFYTVPPRRTLTQYTRMYHCNAFQFQ